MKPGDLVEYYDECGSCQELTIEYNGTNWISIKHKHISSGERGVVISKNLYPESLFPEEEDYFGYIITMFNE